MDIFIDILKIVIVVLVAFITSWLRDLYARRRRVDKYQEHLFKIRLELYHELWKRYVKTTRTLGNKNISLTTVGLSRELKNELKPNNDLDHRNEKIKNENILNEVEEFISYARSTYILLDSNTNRILDEAINIIEGRITQNNLIIDWHILNKKSLLLYNSIRSELGIVELKNIEDIARKKKRRKKL